LLRAICYQLAANRDRRVDSLEAGGLPNGSLNGIGQFSLLAKALSQLGNALHVSRPARFAISSQNARKVQRKTLESRIAGVAVCITRAIERGEARPRILLG
jgi:hypothetical protein